MGWYFLRGAGTWVWVCTYVCVCMCLYVEAWDQPRSSSSGAIHPGSWDSASLRDLGLIGQWSTKTCLSLPSQHWGYTRGPPCWLFTWVLALRASYYAGSTTQTVLFLQPFPEFLKISISLIYCGCVYACVPSMYDCLQMPEEVIRSSGVGITDICKPAKVSARNKTWVLWKRSQHF